LNWFGYLDTNSNMTHFYLFSLNNQNIVIISASNAKEANTKFQQMTPDQLFVLRKPSKYIPIHYIYIGSSKDYIKPIELTDPNDIYKMNLDKDIISLVTHVINPQSNLKSNLTSGIHFSTDEALDPNRANLITLVHMNQFITEKN